MAKRNPAKWGGRKFREVARQLDDSRAAKAKNLQKNQGITVDPAMTPDYSALFANTRDLITPIPTVWPVGPDHRPSLGMFMRHERGNLRIGTVADDGARRLDVRGRIPPPSLLRPSPTGRLRVDALPRLFFDTESTLMREDVKATVREHMRAFREQLMGASTTPTTTAGSVPEPPPAEVKLGGPRRLRLKKANPE